MDEENPRNDRKPKQPVCTEYEIPKATSAGGGGTPIMEVTRM